MKLCGGWEGREGRTKDAAVGDFERPGYLVSFTFRVSCRLSETGGAVWCLGGTITLKVLDAFVAPVMLPSRRVVPFYAEPRTGRAGDLADVPDRADDAVVGQSLTDLGDGRHDRRVSAARGAREELGKDS